ncbi:hypothetical protein, partial [Pseudomonas syringae]
MDHDDYRSHSPRSASYTSQLLILAEGRVSGPGDASLVREDGVSVDAVFQLKAPFRPRRLTLKDQSKQNPGSVSGPT